MIFGTEKNPKGPQWSRARKVEKNLGVAKIEFMTPKNSAPFQDRQWENEPDTFDLKDPFIFNKNGVEKVGDLETLIPYSNSWEFRGLPILEGYCGDIRMFVEITKKASIAVNQNLFNPTDFNETLIESISSSYLGKSSPARLDDPYDLTDVKWPRYLSPINHQWFQINNVTWSYFESQSLIDRPISISIFTPITEDTYISFTFVITRSAMNAGNSFRIEKRVPKTNFMTLINNIIKSIKIEYKDEAYSEEQIKARDAFNSMEVLPVIRPTESYIELSKTVMQAWSSRGYQGKSKSEDSHAHRAAPEEVSQFIDSLMETRFRDNALKIGDIIYRDFVDQSANEKEIAATKSLENT